MENLVAIVGRPNVGKSSLFNKLINKRVAIVHDQPGVTRDRLYHEIRWKKHQFNIIDTGGIEVENSNLQQQIKIQTQIAIEEAKTIIFVVDGRNAPTPDDYAIASMLRNVKDKHIIIAANKLENLLSFEHNWWSLGFEVFQISALHGNGIGDLLDNIVQDLEPKLSEKLRDPKLTILGKPNSGKSSLLNALLKTNRAIVSSQANTTRDSIKETINFEQQQYEIIDTAGINRKSRLVTSVEHYALMRAKASLEEANIVLLVMDATQEITHFDARIIGYAAELFKPIILILNKWDLMIKNPKLTQEKIIELRKEFKFVTWAPIVFISALKRTNLPKLLATISLVHNNLNKHIKTSLINELIIEMQAIQPATTYKGGRLHVEFGQQIKAKIPTFVFKVNNKKFLHFSFERALQNKIRQAFGFEGTPLKLIFKDKLKDKLNK